MLLRYEALYRVCDLFATQLRRNIFEPGVKMDVHPLYFGEDQHSLQYIHTYMNTCTQI